MAVNAAVEHPLTALSLGGNPLQAGPDLGTRPGRNCADPALYKVAFFGENNFHFLIGVSGGSEFGRKRSGLHVVASPLWHAVDVGKVS